MKKWLHILITALIMIVISRFVIRIVDATVQIDDDIMILILFLLIINLMIGFLSCRIYQRERQRPSR